MLIKRGKIYLPFFILADYVRVMAVGPGHAVGEIYGATVRVRPSTARTVTRVPAGMLGLVGVIRRKIAA